MGTLLLPPIHFNDRVYDSTQKPREGSVPEDGQRPSTGETSSSSTAKREPLSLPMTVTVNQTQNDMSERRSSRRRRQTFVGHMAKASVVQCREHKRLFDDALKRCDSVSDLSGSATALAGTGDDSMRCSTPSGLTSLRSPTSPKSLGFSVNSSQQSGLPTLNDTGSGTSLPEYARSSSCSIRYRYNGPTVVGSPLYNRPPRPLTEPRPATSADANTGGFNHERFRTQSPEVRRHMERVSNSYRVANASDITVPTNDQSINHGLLKTSPRYSDVLLIPTDSSLPRPKTHTMLSKHDISSSGFAKQSGADDGARLTDLGLTEDAEKVTVDAWKTGENKPQDHERDPAEQAGQDKAVLPGAFGSLNLGSPGLQNGIESNHLDTYKVTEEMMKEEAKPKKRSDGIPPQRSVQPPQGNAKATSENGSSESSSGLPSRPSSAHYWRRQTWVDDATVTVTEDSEKEDEEKVEATPRQSQSPRRPLDTKPGKAESKGGEKGKSELQKSPVKTVPDNQKQVTEEHRLQPDVDSKEKDGDKTAADVEAKVQVLNLNDLKKRRASLPDFICPSSEEKSRESAVRDWLETTSIYWVQKTAPLM